MVTLSLVLACVWVVVAACVAMLPLEHQYLPGVTLLLAAPLLLIWVGTENGWTMALIALFAVLSLFRRPLVSMARKAFGR